MLISFLGMSKSDCMFGSPSPVPLKPTGPFVQVNLAQTEEAACLSSVHSGDAPWVLSALCQVLAAMLAAQALPPVADLQHSFCLWVWCVVRLAGHRMAGPCFRTPAYGLAFQLTCKILPPTCLISALLGYGFGFKAVSDALPFNFVNQSISFFRQCFYMKTKRNKKQQYFWVPSQVCGF